MDFIRFIFSKRFLVQLLLASLISLGLLAIVMVWLNIYTGHKKYIVVPDFRGQLVTGVMADENYKNFDFVVIDSVFEMGQKPGTILSQDPLVNSKVKHNRKIYVTVVSSVPDQIVMPDLKYLTLRQAVSMMESYGLKMGSLSYTRSFDEDAVQQQYFEGKPVKAGTKVYKGSIIDLVVGLGSKGMSTVADTAQGPVIDDTLNNEL
jgi:eukaryotic-like serine/threonine-protein kinase